mmetsp:Transcript_10941/g.15304  ORF Transcript_10941/g.15304 Transcript_10941/m.15304 type:complete len:82 (-) Transcript_10941:421-666(-)
MGTSNLFCSSPCNRDIQEAIQNAGVIFVLAAGSGPSNGDIQQATQNASIIYPLAAAAVKATGNGNVTKPTKTVLVGRFCRF